MIRTIRYGFGQAHQHGRQTLKAESRDRRRDEILDIAVALLAERGYRDASMIEIARRASASKETLYAWFGDKRGLFEAVIRRNASEVQALLERHLKAEDSIESQLIEFGTALHQLLLGDSAVAINRAAIAEAPSDPTLARLLSQAGREATLPHFLHLLDAQVERRSLRIEDRAEAAEQFLGLLLGDRQVRRLLGLLAAPSKGQSRARATQATHRFLALYST